MTQQEIQKRLNQPYSTQNWKEVVKEVFPNVQLLDPIQDIPVDNDKVESFRQLGNVKLNDGKSLALFELKLKNNVNLIRNRVELNNLVSQYIDQDQSHGVLSIFEQGGDDYRFTFSARATEFSDAENDFLTKKTDTKRFTYLLGKNESCKTPALRLYDLSTKKSEADINTIQDAFSVEKLSKEFFKDYLVHYKRMVDYLTESPSYKTAIFQNDEKAIRDFVKLTLGRVVFIQFLQKKRWMGVPAEDQGWETGDPYFLKNSFRTFKYKDVFYSSFLEPLFFETLNKDGRPNQIFFITGTKVPYLNGGLFEKGKENSQLINFPAAFFEELFEFLDRYNFTIDESDPKEQEVGIDPEMLGHIFENLLEDNKDKGAFYTPKEIVHYMCQESLLEYLKTFLEEKGKWPTLEGDQHALEEAFSNFIKKKEGSGIIDYDRELAIALRDVKICDPAIGSGAFPMGLLNEIFHAVYILFQASPDVVGEEWGMEEWKPNVVKKNIIQNSIYGVDIEKGAVDIARLRFWLSLIVDEPEPEALPNLDYKIIVGNSLISKLGDAVIDIDWNLNDTSHGLFGEALALRKADLLKKISAEQKEFFNPESDKRKLATDIRNLKIDLLINQLELMVKTKGLEKQPTGTSKKIAEQTSLFLQTLGWKNSIQQLGKLKNQPQIDLDFFDWKIDFPGVLNEVVTKNPGFDIVIGNPPYVNFRDIKNEVEKKIYLQKYKTTEYQSDLFIIFIEKSYSILNKKNGVFSFIIPNGLTNNLNNSKIRKYILGNSSITSIVNTPIGAFESATVDTIILSTCLRFRNKKIQTLDFINKKFSYIGEIDQFEFENNSNFDFNFLTNEESRNILGKIEVDTIPLNEICISSSGIKEYEVGKGSPPQTRNDCSDKVFNSSSKLNSNYRRHITGSEVENFLIKHGGEYILYGKNLAAPRNPYFFEPIDKVIVREIPGKKGLKAAYTNEDFTIKNTAHIFIPNNSFTAKYLCAILNSRLIGFYFINKFSERDDVFPKAKIGQVRQLPIKRVNANFQTLIENILDLIIERKLKDEDSFELEEKLNSIVYRIYNLHYNEIKYIDPEFNLSEEEYNTITLE